MKGALWGPTYVGMSLDELLTVKKEAHMVDKGDKLYGGALECARIDEYTIFGECYSIAFYFNNSGLSQVTIQKQKEDSYDDNLMHFNNLLTALCAKYGHELSRFDSGHRTEVNWLSGKTNIVLFLSGDGSSVVTVVYQDILAEEAAKL